MGIESIVNKSIYCNNNHISISSFDELKKAFWTNANKLDALNPTDPLYSELYHENDAILEKVHELNIG